MKNLINTFIQKPLKSILVSSVFLFGLMLTNWQLKKAFIKLDELTHAPVEKQINDTVTTNDHLNKLTLNGQFLPEHTFVQPRTNKNHIPGFQVWVPFKSQDKIIITSLGFQETVSVPNGTNIHGTIHMISSPPFRLSNYITSGQKPYTVGQLDLPLFSKIIDHPLESYVLVLDHSNDLSLSTSAIDDVLKHFNYTAQFFIITSIMCYYMVRKIDWT